MEILDKIYKNLNTLHFMIAQGANGTPADPMILSLNLTVAYDEAETLLRETKILLSNFDEPAKEEKKYVATPEIENRFTYHAPKAGQPEKYVELRETAKRFAYQINELCPESREKSIALMRLDETIMWANASIARNE